MAEATPRATLRLVGRLSVSFVMDLVKLGRWNGDLIDGLIILAIVQANIAPMARDLNLQRTYATYDAAPPDELRRPISISAVAHSLRLAYETVRRRVSRLASQGACVVTPQGLYVSRTVLSSPSHKLVVVESYELTRALYYRLRGLGDLTQLPRPAAAAQDLRTGEPPVRAVVRLSTDYGLRVLDGLTSHIGELTEGMIFLDVVRANTEHLSDAERGTDADDASGLVADDLREPVRIAAVASRLGVPEETIRRHGGNLVRNGRCVRTPRGLIVPAGVLAQPGVVQLMHGNLRHLRRMFAGLDQLGILAEWDLQQPAPPGAA